MRTSGKFDPWQKQIADKREFIEIQKDPGYWETFWLMRNGPLPQSNVVKMKEAA